MNSIPKEWRLKPHYQPGLLWLCREPRPIKFLGEEIPAVESKEYPGWYFLQRGDPMQIVDSLEEALSVLKSRLKHWKQNDLLGRPAPMEVSSETRKQMVLELLNTPIATPPPDHDPDQNEPLPPLLERKWELGEYMLVALIEYTPFRPEFSTRFGQPNNPVRSLAGQVCTLKAASQEDLDREADDQAFKAPWKQIAIGPVQIENNRLTVGFWSKTFADYTEVIGVAYEEASIEDEEMSYFLSKGAPR